MDKGLVQPEKLEKLGIHKEGMKKTLTEEASEGWKEIEGFVAGLGIKKTRYSTKWLLCIVAKPLDIHLQVRQAAALASISSRQSQVGYGSDCTIARTCYGALKDCVKEVYDFVKSVVDNKQPAKLSFFSAHDNSMAALLNALQIDVESQIP
ncbi:uncharacterized protein KRP23_8308 [Phytophthora ramorum]|uniref:uncharacterized protein n=1 Tax=Phytophthora ramorum TaxID=164328 RepID=UPI0030B7A9E1|nr:hypothetical protein KRP23_8308 [Phytophthora ramorum]